MKCRVVSTLINVQTTLSFMHLYRNYQMTPIPEAASIVNKGREGKELLKCIQQSNPDQLEGEVTILGNLMDQFETVTEAFLDRNHNISKFKLIIKT